MRAVVIKRFGDPSGMVLDDLPEPTPGPREVLIEIEAIGVAGVDAVIRRGTLAGFGFEPGLVPGSEVAGRVTAAGAGAAPELVGRRVWAFTGRGGGYAERALASVDDLTVLPDGLSSRDAVAVGSAAPVARLGLERAGLGPGQSVLVRGAAGSIGLSAVELAVAAGASTVAVTTATASRGDRLRGFGATHVLDRSGNGVDAPEQFDIVLDLVGGPLMPDFIDRLAPNGRMVVLGVVAGLPPADFGMRLLAAFQQSRSVATFSLDTVPRGRLAAVRRESFDQVVEGRLSAVVHDVLPLAAAAAAHRAMDDGEVFGRIVLVP